MNKKRILIFAATLAILVGLFYMEFRTWKRFDWAVFRQQSGQVHPLSVLYAVALIYIVYFLRAVRWKIFLKPVCAASSLALTPPTVIGFTGLALLGRPGELIRPYLIARRHSLTFSSQLAVWAVERIFDTAAVVFFLIVGIFASSSTLHTLPYFQLHPEAFQRLRGGGLVLTLLVAGMTLGAVAMRRHASSVAAWTERRFGRFSPSLGHHAALRVRAFGEGFNTLQDFSSFLQASGLSILIWMSVALAYVQVTHAYPNSDVLSGMTVAHVLLLMAASMAGSVLQLPAVGGGSQLAVIAVLEGVFEVPPELAVSCGLLLWLVTFVAVVPLGLALARHEHVSLRRLTAESEKEEEGAG